MGHSIFPASIYGVNSTNLNSVPTTGNNYDTTNKIPRAHIQSCSMKVDLNRESVQELGRKAPYYRFANFPVEVTCEFEVISTSGPHIYFSVTSSGVTGAVVVRLEGSLTNAAGSFFNLSTSNADITISTNTTEAYYTQAPVKFVRVNVISIASGTPTIKVSIGVCR
jgi:hypothetical protein